jgi:hypothetical protein
LDELFEKQKSTASAVIDAGVEVVGAGGRVVVAWPADDELLAAAPPLLDEPLELCLELCALLPQPVSVSASAVSRAPPITTKLERRQRFTAKVWQTVIARNPARRSHDLKFSERSTGVLCPVTETPKLSLKHHASVSVLGDALMLTADS